MSNWKLEKKSNNNIEVNQTQIFPQELLSQSGISIGTIGLETDLQLIKRYLIIQNKNILKQFTLNKG